MKYLFFIVHPSKFHLFKRTINALIDNGNIVDICISSKDVLEDLVINEGWDYTNLFPSGRKYKNIPVKINAFIFLARTINKLLNVTKDNKYDLFITDDALGIVGRMRNVPTIHFADDDYSIISTSRVLFKFANYILAPDCTDLEKYNSKKISFMGYKQSAYLRPNHFTPDQKIINSFNPNKRDYFILRLVSLTATHDMGKKGIGNNILSRIIAILEDYGNVYITAEREIPSQFEKYKLKIGPADLLHALYYSKMLITDSQSMSLEAGLLGTPFIRFNSFINKISVLKEIEDKYQLGYGINSDDPEKLFNKISYLLNINNIKETWKLKINKMLSETIDLSSFMTWLFQQYPESIIIIKKDKQFQHRFK